MESKGYPFSSALGQFAEAKPGTPTAAKKNVKKMKHSQFSKPSMVAATPGGRIITWVIRWMVFRWQMFGRMFDFTQDH